MEINNNTILLKDTLVYKNVRTQRNTASTKNVRKNKYTLIYVHMQNKSVPSFES